MRPTRAVRRVSQRSATGTTDGRRTTQTEKRATPIKLVGSREESIPPGAWTSLAGLRP
jgi:hypothetical protein